MTIKTTCFAICVLLIVHSSLVTLPAQSGAMPPPSAVEKMAEKLEPSIKTEIQARLESLQNLASLTEPIDPSAHSNGCGPAWLPGFPFLINTQTFSGKDTITKQKVVYTVSFKPACDLHDAGYAGVLVINRFGASPWDYSTRSKESVDTKFFNDLCKICDLTIPGSNPEAQEKCKTSKLGARGYHYAVQTAGYFTFDCNPLLAGRPWKQPCTRAYRETSAYGPTEWN